MIAGSTKGKVFWAVSWWRRPGRKWSAVLIADALFLSGLWNAITSASEIIFLDRGTIVYPVGLVPFPRFVQQAPTLHQKPLAERMAISLT